MKGFNKIFGILIILSGVWVMSLFLDDEINIIGIIVSLLWCGMGGFIAFFDPKKFLEFKTARIHEFKSDGYIHTKDKATHVYSYNNSIHSNQDYTIRIKTPVGFFDAHDHNAYITYREGDKVKILVRTRYNKKDEPFMQETLILGALDQDVN